MRRRFAITELQQIENVTTKHKLSQFQAKHKIISLQEE